MFLTEEPLDSTAIPFSNAKVGRRRKVADGRWLVVDRIVCRPGGDLQALQRDVRQLATKLSQADPFTFGLLNCKGVMRTVQAPRGGTSSFDLIFRAPGRPEEFRSLRQALVYPGKNL